MPVTVGLVLIVRGDLEGERLAVLELRAAVETETRNPQDGELHGQHIAFLASRIVSWRRVNRAHFTVRERGGIEARRLFGVLVEPEANRVLRDHDGVLLARRFHRSRLPHSSPSSCQGSRDGAIEPRDPPLLCVGV